MGGEALSKYLDPGSRGGKVDFITLLFILTRIGHCLKEKLKLGGGFKPGGVLERVVKLFQRIHGLEPDGKFGPKTSDEFERWYLVNHWAINDILEDYLTGEGAMNNLRMVILTALGLDPDCELELNGIWGEIAKRKTSILQAGYGLEETGEWDDVLDTALTEDFGIDFATITPELFTQKTFAVSSPEE